jgi:putative DNA modification/repair radical SAM protein
MERLVRVAKQLRLEHNFNGYIHLKAIPGASDELMHEAGLFADRLSVNIEIPSEENLKKVAPEKNYKEVFEPMNYLAGAIEGFKEEKKVVKKAPLFAPAGQSTQMVIGATPENDQHILNLASDMYKEQKLRRVYYSGYIPISDDNRLPALKQAPLIRENRLYQSDWLMRFYGFKVEEIVNDQHPDLDLELDPKLAYALRNPQHFPIDINKAPYEMILRIPGIGVKSAKKIVAARKHRALRLEHLKKIGIVMKRAKYFMLTADPTFKEIDFYPDVIREQLTHEKYKKTQTQQLSLFS